ncbi:MAG TPA: VOC family protein [Acidimicrobiales bacterium]|nr:VOC family protein [Acidimicrobiales bacterium]
MEGRTPSDPSADRHGRRDYWGVVLDARDAHELARFYSDLLGWPIAKDQPGDVALLPPDGVAYLAFQTNHRYVRPVWPDDGDSQQMMVHLDVEVDDLDVAVASALELGAQLAASQPQADVRVMLDPDGHPFCLYRSSED